MESDQFRDYFQARLPAPRIPSFYSACFNRCFHFPQYPRRSKRTGSLRPERRQEAPNRIGSGSFLPTMWQCTTNGSVAHRGGVWSEHLNAGLRNLLKVWMCLVLSDFFLICREKLEQSMKFKENQWISKLKKREGAALGPNPLSFSFEIH